MAAAAPDFITLHQEPSNWADATPDYAVLMNVLGSGSASAAADVALAFHNLATRSPVVVAFVLDGDENHVQVGFAPMYYPGDLTNPQPDLDGLMVVLTGSDPGACTPVVLPTACFGRIAATRCDDVATITGPTGHGAAPAVVRTGPHAATVATATEIRVRRVLLLPPTAAADAIGYLADGRYSLPAFYNRFVLGKHDSADLAERALWAETALWFRAASTNTGAGQNLVRVTPSVPTTLPVTRLLGAFTTQRIRHYMSLQGVGGPQLSNHAFQAGVNQLAQVLTDNHDDSKAFETQARLKTFRDKHGAALENRILRLTGAVDEAHLPEIHRLLVNSPKGREYSILNCQLAERAHASPLPLGISNAPLATPGLLETVFRSYEPMNSGLFLGRGLTPFAIICEGHADVESLKKIVKSASLVESGGSLTLSDAASLTTNDVRLPTEAFIAVEKLLGWSVVVDVFHGHNTPIADQVRTAVEAVHPHLHRIVTQSAETHTVGMELVCRVLYEFQQDYFAWASKVSQGMVVPVPDFSEIVDKVQSYRVHSLCVLPPSWYVNLQGESPSRTRSEPSGTLREQTGTVPRNNPNPDQALLTRFRDCGHSSIKSMIGEHAVTVPKIGGKEICLSWALRGTCSNNCKRKEQHKQYSRDVVQKIHALMDACGVANSQP